ncbi:MAG: hypothetical protein CSB21_03710 [Deltaproteobacteria bacterium]|nr:MAG: hypothetical protein CSB21_03710 [Deltaproteobacteria bacterium]
MTEIKELIILVTDFGTKDAYVSIMKGVILSFNKNAHIIDGTHEIFPQNIKEASDFLAESVCFYPKGSIHVVVVDPGVGTKRNILVVSIGGRIVIAPDNGVLSGLVYKYGIDSAYKIKTEDWCVEPSDTFHGRDIFAPVAAKLSKGEEPMDNFLEKILVSDIYLPKFIDEPVFEKDKIIGNISKIDRFGNLISNISRNFFLNCFNDCDKLEVYINSINIGRIKKTYMLSKPGDLTALWNSSGMLEIAVVNSSAEKEINLSGDDAIYIYKR